MMKKQHFHRILKAMTCCVVAFLLAACTKGPTPGQLAQQAALNSYRHLIEGRYDDFVGGRAGADSLPPSYREQLVAASKQFMAQQRAAHGGIVAVAPGNVYADSTLHLMQVFLVLTFGDSLQEEVVVPMVEQNGQWKMK